MADSESPDVSKQEFSVAYDGAVLAKSGRAHSIDVHVLAPALLAFGKLIREANTEFNGKKATAKVLVVSDFEHKCFNINFEVIVSAMQQIKTLLGSDGATTAKEVLMWMGLLGLPKPADAAKSFFGYLKEKDGREVATKEELTDATQSGFVQVTFRGGVTGPVTVQNHIYNLSENPKALRAARDALLPLGQDGFDEVHIRQDGATVGSIDMNDADAIVRSCNLGIEQAKDEEDPEPEVEITPAWLSVYSPVFDPAATNWRFRLGKDIIYADISDTDIARQAIDRGGVGVEDAYQVRLEVTTPVSAKGVKDDPSYKVLEVVRFVEASPTLRQTTFFEPPRTA